MHKFLLPIVVLGLLLSSPCRAQSTAGPVMHIALDGTFTAAHAAYLERALSQAQAADATALVVRLGTSGGIVAQARQAAAAVAASTVPVVVYIGPAGVQAGTPGALLISAASVAAMAPDTTFGSALPLTSADDRLSAQTQEQVWQSTIADLTAWNAAHGRSAAWVERAVRDGALITSQQATSSQPPIVDLVAASDAELLTLLDGRDVRLSNGQQRRIAALGSALAPIDPTAIEQIQLALADPTVAFVLLVLGALAIYMEFATPSIGAFAGLGATCFLASAVGMAALPLQPWALLLLLLGVALIGTEFVVPTHGGLTVAGVVVLLLGGVNLIDPQQAPGVGVSPWALGGTVTALVGVVAGGITLAMRARSRPLMNGTESLIGKVAEVRRALDPRGMVFIDGALWQAICDGAEAQPGEFVRVVAIHKLNLIVTRLEDGA